MFIRFFHTIKLRSVGIIAMSVLSSQLALAQVANEDVKWLAGDGAAGHRFGVSFAMDGGVVVVGAHRDTVNGDLSGSAYLYSAVTGSRLSSSYQMMDHSLMSLDSR